MKQEIRERIEKIQKGEVPEGYQKTKVGIIPDDWDVTKLSLLAKITMGQSPDSSFYNNQEIGIPLIQGNADINNRITSPKIFTSQITKTCDVGDIIMSVRAPVGNISKSIHKACIGRGVCSIKSLLVNDYLYHYLLFVEKKWIKFAQGSTFEAVNSDGIKRYNICLPLKSEEQQKIAEILSTWDKAIELKEKFIEEKKELKRGLMQKLLFKRVTRNILWNETQLRKCLIPTSYPVNKPSEPYYALGIRSHCKGTLVRYIEDPEKIAMDTLYEVKENELIVNITFAWEGAITLLSKKDEGKLVSHRFPTYNFNKEYSIPDYFKHLVKTKWFVFQLGLLSPGGAGRNRVLNKTNFLKLKVLLPSVEEQRKIAEFLNSLDNEIDLLNKELNQLKEQKRGLMQLLLTGIVRVEVN